MKIKKYIVVILVAIIVYFALNFVYKKLILEDNYKEVYVLVNDVKKGERIDYSKIEKIKYDSNVNLGHFSKINDINSFIFNNDYPLGTIVTDNVIISEEQYLDLKENKEMVAIKVNNIEDNLCGTIKKGDIINIYVSAMTSEISKIINLDNIESFCSESPNGISTVKILSDVKVLNCYDIEGKIVEQNNNIDSIIIEIDKEIAIKINNLKEYGSFSVSMNY